MRLNLNLRLAVLSAALTAGTAMAAPYVVCDFEQYAVGDTVPMWNSWGNAHTSVAVVEADPLDAGNKVLHVTLSSWDTYPEFPLPDALSGAALTAQYDQLTFRYYRPASIASAYMALHVYLGSEQLYADNGYPNQGDAGQWLQKAYTLTAATTDGQALRFGYSNNATEYYLDDVTLSVEEDDMPEVEPVFDTSDTTALRTYAARLGKQIGVAVPAWSFAVDDDEDARTAVVGGQFNMLVAENEMKFDALQPERGEFAFDNADRLVRLAQRHGMEVRGHTLVWHSQVPSWLSADGEKNTLGYTRAELLDIMRTHIETVMAHYRGQVVEWDVVNECLSDQQSSSTTGYTLRPSVWATGIGADFIDSALVYAHRADPDARLYINDYSVEFRGKSKADALYNLAKRLKAAGIPLDGVGLQSHWTIGQLDSTKLANNIRRYADLGLNCIITELDIALKDPTSAADYQQQAREYEQVAHIMTEWDNCPHLLVWGVTDDLSWRENAPLLFTARVRPKPAYYGVQHALRTAASLTSGLTRPDAAAGVVRTEYFNLHGRRLSEAPAGLSLRRTTYADGTAVVEKVWR